MYENIRVPPWACWVYTCQNATLLEIKCQGSYHKTMNFKSHPRWKQQQKMNQVSVEIMVQIHLEMDPTASQGRFIPPSMKYVNHDRIFWITPCEKSKSGQRSNRLVAKMYLIFELGSHCSHPLKTATLNNIQIQISPIHWWRLTNLIVNAKHGFS